MTNAVGAIIAGVVSIVLIAAVAVLTWHGSINGEAAMTFFGGLAGVGTAAGVGHVATKTGANAARNGGNV